MAEEDVPYSAPGFATSEEKEQPDEDQPNKSVLIKVQKYLDKQIARHSTLDVIKPDAEGIMTTQQQVLVHKEVVTHLRNVKTEIDNKLKELV